NTVFVQIRSVGTEDGRSVSQDSIAEAIVGKQIVALERQAQERTPTTGTARMQLQNLASKGRFGTISLDVARGEVLGV
ncbi:hypothetical protein ACC677_38675, partial [Rhizobium ruizarguesonis]